MGRNVRRERFRAMGIYIGQKMESQLELQIEFPKDMLSHDIAMISMISSISENPQIFSSYCIYCSPERSRNS